MSVPQSGATKLAVSFGGSLSNKPVLWSQKSYIMLFHVRRIQKNEIMIDANHLDNHDIEARTDI